MSLRYAPVVAFLILATIGCAKNDQPATAVLASDPSAARFLGDWSSEGEHMYAITGDAETEVTLRLILRDGVSARIDDAHFADGRLCFRAWFFVDGNYAIPSDEPMEIVLTAVDDSTLTQETRLLLSNGEFHRDSAELKRIIAR